MARIWLIRHGESRAQSGEDRDVRDPELSEKGRDQAVRLKGALAGVRFDRALVSPLRRAWQTFELSGIDAAEAQYDSRLVEHPWDFDGYAALLPLELPSIAAPDRHAAFDLPTVQRARALVAELGVGEECDVALFSHWGLLSRLLLVFLGADAEDWLLQPSLGNTAIALLEVKPAGERVIRRWNDLSHIDGI